MYKRSIYSIVIVLLAGIHLGCVITAGAPQKSDTAKVPLLNSERIQQKFGSYGVKVIESESPRIRISKLYSTHGDKEVVRTFAITTFEESLDSELLEGHRLIVEKNKSIGSTFKDLGFTVTKENLYFGEREFDSQCLYGLMVNAPQPMAVHIYQLLLSKGEKKNMRYAVIAELEHPDYLTALQLKEIYGEIGAPRDLTDIWSSIEMAVKSLKC